MGRNNRNDETNWLNDPGEEEVTDEQFYRSLALSKVDPEEILIPEEKAGYIKFLKTFDPDAEE